MAQIPGSRWLRQNSAALQQASGTSGANIALVLGKYAAWDSLSAGQPDFNKKDHFELVRGLEPEKIIKAAAYQRLLARRNALLGPDNPPFILKTQARLAINLGCESILENHISLHPLFGFPVLPGAAIKGVTRHFVEENRRAPGDEIIQVFGLSSGKSGPGVGEGQVVFLDAWPRTLGRYLELDIMTCHFQKYYQTKGSTDPTDTDNPNPVPFLVIKEGVEFQFALGLSAWGRRALPGETAAEVLDRVKGWVTEALTQYGLGAKTCSGYGWFAVCGE